MSQGQFAVECENVAKNYGHFSALKNLSFVIPHGQCVGFLGPNGAGKSTAISLLMGLRRPTAGTLRVLGECPTHWSLKTKRVMTPQELAFPDHWRAKELLSWVASLVDGKSRSQSAVFEELIQALELDSFSRSLCGALSGGQKRKLALALAILQEPDLLVLDEPTTGLDVESKRSMWSLLRQIKKQGVTIIITSHDLAEIEELADQLLLIDQGELFFSGTPEEIKKVIEIERVEFSLPAAGLAQHIVYLQQWVASSVIENFQLEDKKVTLWVKNSDELIRRLVKEDWQFSKMNLRRAGLEEAFIEIRRQRRAI